MTCFLFLLVILFQKRTTYSFFCFCFFSWIGLFQKKNGFTFRKSQNISQVNFDDSTWFFGGSTMAGSGVDDLNTIPSLYSKLTNENVINFGVPGWNSRQSLNLLINLLSAGYKPSKVIFYDGINEIYN